MEYTFLVIISLIISLTLDTLVLSTNLIKKPRFWIFLIIVIFLQTIVDNWLNGRWFWSGYIVGPYGSEFFSGIKIWHTPLENYIYGIALLWMVVSVFEFLKKAN